MNLRFREILSGATEINRMEAVRRVYDQLLGEALGKKYVEKYFSSEAKPRAQEMVANIIAAMPTQIEGLTWMGARDEKKALEKLAALNAKNRLRTSEGLQQHQS